MKEIKHHLKIFGIVICITVIITLIAIILHYKLGEQILGGITLYCIVHFLIWINLKKTDNNDVYDSLDDI